MRSKTATALLFLFTLSGICTADSWDPPSPITVTSDDGAYRLTIYPRAIASPRPDAHQQCDATLEKLGPRSYELVWRKPFVNEVSPAYAAVTRSGQIVTFDNWHSLGLGDDAIVIYDKEGNLVRKLSLATLLGDEYFNKLPRSTSSVQWGSKYRLSLDEKSIVILVPNVGDHPSHKTINTDGSYRLIRLDISTGQLAPEPTDVHGI